MASSTAAQRRLERLAAHCAAGAGAAARHEAGCSGAEVRREATASCSTTDEGAVIEDEYDYIVVGAGSAGCVVAARLSEDPTVSVLLLEAGDGVSHKSFHVVAPGGFTDNVHTDIDWQFKTAPQTAAFDRRIEVPRGKMLGGSSSLNAMVYVRGHPSNYDAWAREGCEGWSYDEVLPYFKKSEYCRLKGADADFHGTEGPLVVTDNKSEGVSITCTDLFMAACEEAGVPRNDDYNAGDNTGVGQFQMTINSGKRCSTAAAFLHGKRGHPAVPPTAGTAVVSPIDRPNLTVAPLCHVTRVMVQGDTATGVLLRRGSNKLEELRAVPEIAVRCRREVIVSGGSINSPWLLLSSGIGPAAHLRDVGVPVVKNLPVGESYSDHLMFPMMFTTKTDTPLTLRWGTRRIGLMAEYLLRGAGPGAVAGLQATVFKHSQQAPHNVDGAPDAPDTQYHFTPVLPDEKAFNALGIPTDIGPHTDPSTFPMYGFTVLPTLLRPVSRGRLRLRSSDPMVEPDIDPCFFSDERDVRVLMDAAKDVRRIVAQDALKSEGVHELVDTTSKLKPGTDEYDRDYILKSFCTVYHPVGTCRMGAPDAATTVVDPRCRVLGLRGLRVADASVMPHVISGNTNAPSIMIGEKVADMVKQDWRGVAGAAAASGE